MRLRAPRHEIAVLPTRVRPGAPFRMSAFGVKSERSFVVISASEEMWTIAEAPLGVLDRLELLFLRLAWWLRGRP